MLERWTVDSLADEIDSQFKGADPTPKLLRRFFHLGLRHGKQDLPPRAIQFFIENAVEIATSKLGEEYIDEKQAAGLQEAGLRARRKSLSEWEEDHADVEILAPTATKLGGALRGPNLSGALEALNRQRRAAQEAERDAEADQRRDELQQLDQQLATLEEQLEELPEKYRQVIESCHETGELIWSRYRTGYIRGTSKRGEPEEGDDLPEDIEFDMPLAFDLLLDGVPRPAPATKETDNGPA